MITLTDYTDITFCPWCGKKFKTLTVKFLDEHISQCNDIDEEYRGEIDNSSIENIW